MKEGYQFGKDQGQQKVAEQTEDVQMPYQTYNWILFKCFDSCIHNFDNKGLDAHEGSCVDECTNSLKDAPDTFGRSQMFFGFKGKKQIGL